MTVLNTRPPFDQKPKSVASFGSFKATIDLGDVLMPEHWRILLFLYAKTKMVPHLQDAYNPTPAPWRGISLVRFRPVVTGAVAEDSVEVSGSLPGSFPVVAALIVVRGLFAPSSIHLQQTYTPAQPGEFPPPDTGGGGGGGAG